MRIVNNSSEFKKKYTEAKNEARISFNDDSAKFDRTTERQNEITRTLISVASRGVRGVRGRKGRLRRWIVLCSLGCPSGGHRLCPRPYRAIAFPGIRSHKARHRRNKRWVFSGLRGLYGQSGRGTGRSDRTRRRVQARPPRRPGRRGWEARPGDPRLPRVCGADL